MRPVVPSDREALAALFALPAVYQFLWDGAAPSKALVDELIAQALEAPTPAHGMWVLEDRSDRVLGSAVLFRPDSELSDYELVYLLHPRAWGRGLATRMARSVVDRAFRLGAASVLAGADVPNSASIRVMERLGMHHVRNVGYPLGPGVEYIVTRAEWLADGAGEGAESLLV